MNRESTFSPFYIQNSKLITLILIKFQEKNSEIFVEIYIWKIYLGTLLIFEINVTAAATVSVLNILKRKVCFHCVNALFTC